jgi:hypothetical protein
MTTNNVLRAGHWSHLVGLDGYLRCYYTSSLPVLVLEYYIQVRARSTGALSKSPPTPTSPKNTVYFGNSTALSSMRSMLVCEPDKIFERAFDPIFPLYRHRQQINRLARSTATLTVPRSHALRL